MYSLSDNSHFHSSPLEICFPHSCHVLPVLKTLHQTLPLTWNKVRDKALERTHGPTPCALTHLSDPVSCCFHLLTEISPWNPTPPPPLCCFQNVPSTCPHCPLPPEPSWRLEHCLRHVRWLIPSVPFPWHFLYALVLLGCTGLTSTSHFTKLPCSMGGRSRKGQGEWVSSNPSCWGFGQWLCSFPLVPAADMQPLSLCYSSAPSGLWVEPLPAAASPWVLTSPCP